MSNLFTKTDYKNFLDCGCYLWLAHHKRESLPPPSASDLFREKEGEKVDALAKQLFPSGREVRVFNEEGWHESKKLIDEKTSVLFQPTIIAENGLSCRADILTYNPEAQAFEIREVKSATSVRTDDIQDVAFQRLCFEGAGIPITKIYLIYINSKYVKHGSIDPHQFFVTEDVTHKVNIALEETRNGIQVARKHLIEKTWPHARIIESCTNPKSCHYLKYYLQGITDHQALTKTLSSKYMIELLRRDIIALSSLNSHYVHELGYAPEAKYVDNDAIRGELKGLVYPFYFLDYETYSSPIPKFDGIKPWQQIPFQYSVHIKRAEGAAFEHKEFIAVEDKNPIADLALHLKQDIGERGSIVVWNAAFEATRNKEIAESHPAYKSLMTSVNERMFDLMTIFRKKLYTEHKFYRSYSLKNILPVLVPELSYKDLIIQEGGTASISWPNLIDAGTPVAEKNELKKDMLLYCGLDTLAMVRILENVEKEVADY